jgi:hypothetical protein
MLSHNFYDNKAVEGLVPFIFRDSLEQHILTDVILTGYSKQKTDLENLKGVRLITQESPYLKK